MRTTTPLVPIRLAIATACGYARARWVVAGFVALMAGFGASGDAIAATSVSGSITASTTWSTSQSPYLVTADVTIDNAATLTIQPGVVVNVGAGANLIVNSGALNATGTTATPIVITSYRDVASPNPAPAPGDWGQIKFLAGTLSAATTLDHVTVKYGTGMVVTGASPALNNLTLLNNSGPAISIDLNASPTGSGLSASGNGLNGISVPAGVMLGNVSWALRGIPYVVTGALSVGQPPSADSIAPNSVAQGSSVDALISGSRLTNPESVSVANAGVTATLQAGAADTSIPVRITATANAPLGTTNVTVQVAAGIVTIPLNVLPPSVILGVVPSPIAVPPDNAPRNFLVTLSRADTVANTVSVSVDSTSLATVSPASATIAAGQTQVTFQITGKVAGQTTLRVSSSTLAGTSVPVYVTADFAGMNAARSPLVGVVVGSLPTPPQSSFSTLLASPQLGVSVGSTVQVFQGTLASPTVGVAVGSATVPTTGLLASPIVGVNVADAAAPFTALLASPTVGIAVGNAGASYSGLLASPIIGIAVGNAGSSYSGLLASPMMGIVVGAQQQFAYSVTSPTLGIATGPTAFAVQPNALPAGFNGTLSVQGFALPANTVVSVSPSTGITLGTPQVNANGSSIAIPITVDTAAPLTQRLLSLTTGATPLRFAAPSAAIVTVTAN